MPHTHYFQSDSDKLEVIHGFCVCVCVLCDLDFQFFSQNYGMKFDCYTFPRGIRVYTLAYGTNV